MSDATDSPWRHHAEGPLQVVTLDRPPLNLWAPSVHRTLSDLIARFERDPPRGILIRAAGKVWTAGDDVRVHDSVDGEETALLCQEMLELARRLEQLPCPVVFAAHALCLTWGLELGLCCDVLLAAESARFGLIEAKVAQIPGMGGAQRIAERAGPARARLLVMSAELFDAATLEQWGVVSRVYPDDEFEASSNAFARSLAEGPTLAHAATKELIHTQTEHGTLAADAKIAQLVRETFDTEDRVNATRAFLEDGPKGKATFVGR